MLITNGTVHLEEGPTGADILVRDGTIAAVGTLAGRAAAGEEIFDAAGLDVLPGMIDFHVHVDDRIGGIPLADTFLTGSAAAVATGVTTLVGFVTQGSRFSLQAAVEEAAERVRRGSYCDCHFHLTPATWTDASWSAIERLAGRGFRTLKIYTTYRDAGLFVDYDRIDAILERCAKLDIGLLVHCEDQETLDRAGAHRGSTPFDHTRLRPAAAEEAAIGRIGRLAARRKARLHVVHLSTADGAQALRAAAGRCPPGTITCETAPHYLLLNESLLAKEDGHRLLCTPPLRSEENRACLEELAAKGFFDLFATDHCAFRRDDKDACRHNAAAVPKGIAGTGALVPLLFELLVKKHGLGLTELARRLAANPARGAGLYPRKGTIRVGSDADLVALDPNGPARPIVSSIADAHEPYAGRTTTLDVRRVWLRGETVAADNAPVHASHREGRSLCSP